MKKADGAGLSIFEWELLNDEQVITFFNRSSFIPKGATKINIWRDNDYILHGKIYGAGKLNTKTFNNNDDKNTLLGTFVKSINFTGFSDQKRFKYKVKCWDSKSISSNFSLRDNTFTYEAGFSPKEVEKIFQDKIKPVCLIEWYLNGIEDIFCFSDNITRKKETFYTTEVNGSSHVKSRKAREESGRGLFVNLKQYKFFIKQVPKYFGPEWSNSISIEYRTEWGKIPNKSERKSISEIIGFLFGKNLFNVGFTEYDDDNNLIKATAHYTYNCKKECKNTEQFPIPINTHENWGKVSIIVSNLVAKYLKLKHKFNLDKAIWDFWTAQNTPIPSGIAILFSGIETMNKSWFESSSSKSKGVLMQKVEYETLMKNVIEGAENALANSDNKDKILNKIKTAYELSATRRLPQFLDEIKLPYSQIEELVMKKRHSVVHGDKLNDSALEDWVRTTSATKTFFCRVLLKLLGYNGDYYDYSTLGFPIRNINHPLGG